ncbi:MAG: glycoside hydrolase family 3 C-terminal domain-containing protein [Opitutales bacterium]|nr:glycoside hydrolase family 3 C-terminal domain-containing protein [Opitutales bacterium]
MSKSPNPKQTDAEAQLDSLLAALTLDEKIRLIHGDGCFTVAGVPRLGIEDLRLSDGPHGVRQETEYDSFVPLGNFDDATTYLPVGMALSATWNLDRATEFGDVLGAEARARGKDIILGPGVNLIRTPLCGRNFEYMGEDPLQVGSMAVAVIRGIQRHDVAADVKHFACNNQELNRNGVDVLIDERTLRELYLPAFEAAIKEGGCLTVMGAYNLLNGTHCCHHDRLLQTILKDEWGFEGLVVSDWGGVHDADEAARPGLDLEMGGRLGNHYLDKAFKRGLESGTYPMAWLDDKVRRVLRVHQRIGKLNPPSSRATGERLTPKHRAIAKAIADEALVLMKNDSATLPLKRADLRRLAVIGDNATRVHAGGGGSSGVRADYEITPMEGLREALGPEVEIVHVKGYPVEIDGVEAIPLTCLGVADQAGIRGWLRETYANRGRDGAPRATAVLPELAQPAKDQPAGLNIGGWMHHYTATITPEVSGRYTLVARGGDYFSVTLAGRKLFDVWDLTAATTEATQVNLEAGQAYTVEIAYRPKVNAQGFSFGWIPPGGELAGGKDPYAEAEAAARSADAVVVFGGCSHRLDTEGVDRGDMQLPGCQDDLIERVAAANSKTIVVLFGGSAVELPWLNAVPALVQAWYPGQEGGRSLAQLLLGDLNPSGHLPISWPKRLEDVAAHAIGEYGPDRIRYSEGLNLGYRWHDADGPEPLFPFGYGLSYTTFTARSAGLDTTDPANLSLRAVVANTGDRAGAALLQGYVSLPAGLLPHPPKSLAAFTKIFLEPGQSEEVTMKIPARNRSYYDPEAGAWIAPADEYRIHLAWNAAEIVETLTAHLPENRQAR